MSDKCYTICVVDDDPSVCKALSRVIKLAGFNVRSYSSGQEFLDDKQIGSTDLLLLDIKMPVMDGFALQTHLSEAGFSIPIIFITAHEVEQMRTELMGKNIATFLQKPIGEQDLLEAINKGLKRASAQSDIH
jgi:two-component system response regulator FixJ